MAGDMLVVYLLASLRIIAWLILVPPFNNRTVPVLAKGVLALGLAFAITPAAAETSPVAGLSTGMFIAAALTQVAIGLTMGFICYMLFSAVSTAGSIVDVFGGLALAAGFDPMSMNQTTIYGRFYQMLAVVLLFASGAHLLVFGGMLKTFTALPVSASLSFAPGQLHDIVTTAMTVFFITAIQIALPIVAILFVADIALALLTKVAPQMNALNVMFPAKIGLTLFMMGLALPALIPAVSRLADLAVEGMAAVVGAA